MAEFNSPEYLLTEEWRTIPGFESYEVSTGGRVRRMGRVLKPWRHANGYLWVSFSVSGKIFKLRLHHAVLLAFVGPCPPEMQGCHFDDDRSNNALSNLRWGTGSENMQDRIRNGRHNHARKTHCKRGHEFTEANTRVTPGKRHCRACDTDSVRGRTRGRQRQLPEM